MYKANKFSKTKIVIRFDLLQVCPSVLFLYLLCYSYHSKVLSRYFPVSLKLVTFPTV